MNVRAAVEGVDASGHLVLREWHNRMAGRPLPRPFVGSSTTGFHTAPPQGAQVLLLYESGAIPYPGAVVSADDGARTLPTLGAGESAIYGPDGSVLVHATIGTAAKVLYGSPDGSFTVTVDPTLKRLTVTGGTIWQDTTQVTVP